MRYYIEHLPMTIPMGVQSENNAEAVEFDVSDWLARDGSLSFSVWVTRPGETEAYQAANATLKDGILYWWPTSADTAIAGEGRVEILAVSANRRMLSGWTATSIRETTTETTTDAPVDQRPWLDQALLASEEAKAAAASAAASADQAESVVKKEIATLTIEIEAAAPKAMARNLLDDKSGWQDGYYAAYNTGEILPLDGYTVTDFIHVGSAGMIEVGRGVGMFAFYNANKEFLWPGVGIESPDHIQPQYYIIPEGAAYVRFSLLDTLKDNAYAYLLNDNTGPVFYVGQFGNTVAIDGVRQYYDKVTDAIIEAVKYRNSTVYIADGVYDILAELGEEYLAQTFSDTVRGIELRNNIRVVGTPKTYLFAQYDGSNESVRGYFSIFNISGSATIENVNFIGKNIRYCVHDETGGRDIPHCETRYSHCYFQLDNTKNEQCQAMCGIGAGVGYHNTIVIEDCYFDSPVTIVGYPDIFIHNHVFPNSRSRIVVKGNYCKNSTIRITWYGASTEISTAIVTNNSTARPIEHAAETPDSSIMNVDCVMWNNVTH